LILLLMQRNGNSHDGASKFSSGSSGTMLMKQG
jgi:hypothetical protein